MLVPKQKSNAFKESENLTETEKEAIVDKK